MNNEEKNDNNSKSPENSSINKSQDLSSPNNTKKEKKKRNRKKKNEKNTKSKINIENNNFSGGILSEIKQISIPAILSEKENLFKILQSEIINIDKSLSLLNKKKKYYNEIIRYL